MPTKTWRLNSPISRLALNRAVVSTSKFLGLDAPTKLDAKLDAEDVSFTIEFETPDAPRMIDASYDVIALEDPPLTEGG